MSRSRSFLSILALSCLAAFGLSAPARAVDSITYVSLEGTANPAGTSCEDPNVVLSFGNGLADVINNAAEGSIIRLCGDQNAKYYITNVVTINKALTILGAIGVVGPQIVAKSTGGNGTNLFLIDAEPGTQIHFVGVSLRPSDDSSASANGGGIRVLKGKLNLNNVGFYNFDSQGNGGALSLESRYLLDKAVITSSAFINNSAVNGGAIYAADGCAPCTNPSADISESGASADLVNVVFYHNSATNKGGAIYSPNENITVPTSISLNHSSLVDNSAPSGDAILSGANILLKNSILAQRTTDQTFCSGSVDIQDGNLLTNTSCGISTRFQTGDTLESRLVNFQDLHLGHYNQYPFPTFAIYENSVARDFIPSAGDSLTTDVRGAARDTHRDAGAAEYVSRPDKQLIVEPNLGYIRTNDPSGNTLIDAYRVSRPEYSITSTDFAVHYIDAQNVDHDLSNIEYTSLTPTKCSLPSSTSLSGLTVPAVPASQGWCVLEAYSPGVAGSEEFVAFVVLRIYYGTAPSDPRKVVVAARETSIRVKFDAPIDSGSGIQSYQLRVNGGNSFEKVENCVLETLICEVTGLKRNTPYTLTLTMNSVGGRITDFSIGSTKTLQQAGPSVVRTVSVTAKPTKSITVKWAAPAIAGRFALTSYRVLVYLSTSMKKPVAIKTLTTKTRSVVISKLKSKKKYVVRIFAYNDGGYFSMVSRTITVK